MKFFKSLTNLVLYFLLCVSIGSCIEKDDLVEPKPDPEPTPVEKEYELADNVIELEGDLLKHVTSLKGDTLVYNSNTPDDALPEVGEIVIVTQPTDVFPYGFLGKVTKISNDGNINVITEVAALDEAFVYLDVSQSYELTPESSKAISRNAETQTEFKKFTRPFSKEFSDVVSLNGELTLGVKVDATLKIDKRNGKKLRNGKITISTLQEVNMSLDVELEKEFEESVNFPPKAITFPPLQFGPVTLVPALQPYLFIQAEGKIETHPSMFYQQVRTASLVFDGNSWSYINDDSNDPTVEFNLTPDISMQGSIYDGVGVALEFRLYGSEDNKAFIDAKIGPQISGEVTLATDPDSIYESGKDSNLDFGMLFTAGGGAGVKFFFIEKEWSHYPINLSFLQFTRHFFPSFSNHSLAYANGEVSASTNLGRNLLWKQNVGLALYKGDERIEVSEPVEYKFENDFKERNPLEGIFEDIPEEEKGDYSIWSYVKWGDFYIKCEQLTPKKKIKSMSMTEVSTSSLTDKYSFYYTNDSIDRIVHKESYYDDDITYKFNYLNDSTIKVIGTISDEQVVCNLKLNDDGYIKKCLHSYSGPEGSYSQTFEFEYDDDGRMTYMKRSEGNEVWRLVYNNSNAISVSCNGNKTNSISYGNLECPENWIWYGWMMGLDIDEMDIFGLIGMLGKSSKNLPTVNKGLGEEYSLHYNWSMDGYGYPDRVVIDEDGSDYVLNLSWE